MATPKKTTTKQPAGKMDWLSFVSAAVQVGGAITMRILDEKRKGTFQTLKSVERLVPEAGELIKQMRLVQNEELEQARELLE